MARGRTALALGLLAGALALPSTTEVHRPVALLADWTSARLVANAGFEESGSAAAQWTVTGPAGAVSIIAAPAHGGGRALKVSDTGADGVSVRGRPLAVVPGEALTAHAWAQRIDQQAGTLYLEYWRADGTRIDDATTSRDIAAVAGWQAVTVAGPAPPDAITATVLIYSKLAAVGSTAWDDVTVDSAPPPVRKVPNGDFEALRETPKPTSWAVSGGGGTAQLVNSPTHSGNRALRTVDTVNGTGGDVTVLSRAVPVSAGETLTVTVQAMVVSGLAGSLYVEYRRADGSTQDSYKTRTDVTAGAGWRPVTATKTAPADATSVTIRLYSAFAAVGTTLWDDVTIRSNLDTAYQEGIGGGSVLFAGDQRVESYTGLSRRVIKGVPHGDPALPDGDTGVVLAGGTWDDNPRLSGTVLRDAGGTYQMWYRAGAGMGYATSTDGVVWTRFGSGPVFPDGPGGVVENPRFDSADPASWRYHTLYPQNGDYYAAASRNGFDWQTINSGNPVLPGWDVANVTYDPAGGRYVALTKQYPDTAPSGPRTVSVSFSTDFLHWTAPRHVLGSDVLDNETVKAANPGKPDAVSEIYGMAGIRYGEQYLGVPWMFDIHEVPSPGTDPGPDKGRAHLELAASQDLLNWSRPDRSPLITDGGFSSWNWGFQLAGTTLLPVGDEVRLYYGSFAGEHSCTAADVLAARCAKAMGNSRIGLVTWQRDRFVALQAATGGGSLVTRTLAPSGNRVIVNANPGAGQLRVALLDAGGIPVPGYTAADAVPITGDSLATAATWQTHTTLPSTGGPFRLSFALTAGDLYSYAIA
jgi:hypothetical protein